jgi:hypothetical protein
VSAATIAGVAAPALLLPAAYLLWWLDRYRLFPLARFLATAALAGSLGLLIAALWPTAVVLGGALAGPAMQAPGEIAERAPVLLVGAARLALAALAVLVFLMARARVESPVDGLVYGIAAGVGLALPAGWLVAESVAGVDALDLGAQALAPVATGAVVGLGVAFARFKPSWPARVFIALGGAAAAAAAVTGARLAAEASRPWVGWLVPAVTLAGAIAGAFAIELAVSRRELAEEARLGVLPAWAPEVLPRYWRRVRAYWWPRRDERRALSRLLLQLAFRKYQLRHLDDDRATLYSLEVGRLRERARRLLDPGRMAPDGVDFQE